MSASLSQGSVCVQDACLAARLAKCAARAYAVSFPSTNRKDVAEGTVFDATQQRQAVSFLSACIHCKPVTVA